MTPSRAPSPPADLLTVAEASGFRRTSLHREVLDLLRRLAQRTDLLQLRSMGASGLGQDLAYAVCSARKAFDPAAARAAGTPVVLVIGNIHAGEVEGKEAILALARDATLGPLRRLIERATLLLLPNYNPDGNDRIDRKNRALDMERLEGQIGPEEGVGTRYTGKGINLNRDYTKQEAVETRRLAALMAEWRPHVVIDCHTTDGSIHGYDLTFDTSRNLASCPPGPALFVRDTLLPTVAASLFERTGHRAWFYGNFVDEKDPTKGWASYPPLPRYGSHYRGLLGVCDVLLEAYSYVDYETRFRVTHEILVEILDEVGARGEQVLALVPWNTAACGTGWGMGIDYGEPVRDAQGGVSFRHPGRPLFDHEIEGWDLESHLARRVPGRERRTWRSTFLGRYPPTASVTAPAAYVVPASRTDVLRRLASHGVQFGLLDRPWVGERTLASYRVIGREPTASPDVGDHVLTETVFRVECFEERVPGRPDDVWVLTAQPLGRLATYLLEPHADDGLARWGLFDDVKIGDVFPVRRFEDAESIWPDDLRPYRPA